MTQARLFAVFIFSCAWVPVAQTQASMPCPAATAQSYTLLQSFATNGKGPDDPHYSGIIAQSRGGNIFSTAPDTWTNGDGTIFKVTQTGAVTPLHSFSGMDGAESISGLTLSTGGYYWGTTASGGLYGHGTVFKMNRGQISDDIQKLVPDDNILPQIARSDGETQQTCMIGFGQYFLYSRM